MHSWFFNTQYNLSYLIAVQNFKTLDQVVTEKSSTKTYWREGKIKKKAKIILTTLFLFTAIHLIVLSMYTKFEDSTTYRC